MTRTATLIAALALAFSLSGAAVAATGGAPYTLDAKGKCHDASGKFAKTDLCKVAAPKHCRDPKTKKFAKCTAPGAVPA